MQENSRQRLLIGWISTTVLYVLALVAYPWTFLLVLLAPLIAVIIAVVLRRREPQDRRARTSLLAVVAICVSGVALCGAIVPAALAYALPTPVWQTFPTVTVPAAVVGLYLALLALVHILFRPAQVRSGGLVEGAIVLGALALLNWPVTEKEVRSGLASACLSNQKNLVWAMLMYSRDNDDRLPLASNWCDAIRPYVEEEADFVCPVADVPRCGYGYNAGISGMHVDAIAEPGHVVVIFESEAGWNRAGGAELLPPEPRHGLTDVYAWADGHAKVVHRGGTEELRWEPVIAEPAGVPVGGRHSQPVIICTRSTGAGVEFIEHRAATERVLVRRTAPIALAPISVPDGFGLLPSPGGEWLLLWTVAQWDRHGLPERTLWSLLRRADGKQFAVGSSEGPPGLLPGWTSRDEFHLLGRTATVSLRVPPTVAIGPLPEPIPQDEAAERLAVYAGAFLRQEVEWVTQVLQTLHSQRQIPAEHALLRSRGIPGLGMLRHPLPRAEPEAAVSPDGRFAAFAEPWDDAPPISIPSGDGHRELRVPGCHLLVWDRSARKLVWEARTYPRARPSLPSDGRPPMISPSPLAWVAPQIRCLRWSPDGHHLSYTLEDEPGPSVIVVDVGTWKERVRIPNAMNAFVVPDGTEAAESADAP